MRSLSCNRSTMTSKTSSPLESIWQGRAEIWTREGWFLELRNQVATLQASRESIAVSLSKKEVQFALSNVVEARLFRLPLPSLTLIFSIGEDYGLVTLFNFRRQAQQDLLKASGLTITGKRTWRTGLEAGRDKKKYRLH